MVDDATYFRAVVDNAIDLIVVVDRDATIHYANAAHERVLGYGSNQLVGQCALTLVHPDDRLVVAEALGRALGASEAAAEFRVRHADGSWRVLAATAVDLLRDPAVGGLVIYAHDVSGRARVQAELAASEARYRIASELTSDYAYAFRIEADGKVFVEWIVGALASITGFTPEEVARRGGGITLVHPDDLPIALRRVQTLVSGQADASEFRVIAKDGTVRWLRETARPVWDAEQQCVRVFVAAQDISERKRAEEDARQRQAELAHVLRVSTISEMTAGLAHEINQPLAAIVSYAKGSARRMRTGNAQSAELLQVMDEIAAQAVRADEIIRRLREFIRKQPPRRERVDLNGLVREVVRMVEADATRHGIAVQLALSAHLPVVEADRIQIEQVILNLVRNGLEAMHAVEAARSVLAVRTELADGDSIEVAVRDGGEGLPASMADTIFRPFFTTKTNGLGMGLSISRGIVEAHGGRLWAEANPRWGTTFHFNLPRARGEHQRGD